MANKAAIDQQRNDSKIEAFDEKLDKIFDKIDDLSVRSISSKNKLSTIHEGIVSNTVKIMADSELQRERCEKIENKLVADSELQRLRCEKLEKSYESKLSQFSG